MATAINTNILNETFNVYRLSNLASSNYEINPAAKVLHATNIKGRLVNQEMAESQRDGVQREAGIARAFKQILIFESGVDIKTGDYIIKMTNTAKQWFVDFVDDQPGGLTGHHQEAYLSASTYIVAS